MLAAQQETCKSRLFSTGRGRMSPSPLRPSLVYEPYYIEDPIALSLGTWYGSVHPIRCSPACWLSPYGTVTDVPRAYC